MRKKCRKALEKMRSYITGWRFDLHRLFSKKYWEDVQETLFLSSNKDTREAIVYALNQPVEDGTEINWKTAAIKRS